MPYFLCHCWYHLLEEVSYIHFPNTIFANSTPSSKIIEGGLLTCALYCTLTAQRWLRKAAPIPTGQSCDPNSEYAIRIRTNIEQIIMNSFYLKCSSFNDKFLLLIFRFWNTKASFFCLWRFSKTSVGFASLQNDIFENPKWCLHKIFNIMASS